MAKIEAGETIIIVLREPREKIWGILDETNSAGVYMRGIDLNAFDDWVKALVNREPFFGMSDYFFPMWRVERVIRDEPSGEIPSMAEQFQQKTGLEILTL
jgi:hypothetical protein